MFRCVHELCRTMELFGSWFTHPPFVLIMLAQGAFYMVMFFETFISLWLSDTLQVSTSPSGTVTAALPAGILFSIVVFGWAIEQLRPKAKRIAMLVLGALNIAVMFALLAATAAVERTGGCGAGQDACVAGAAALLFASGATVGYIYYIPAAVFAVQFAKDDSAKALAIFDLCSSIVAVLFTLFSTKLSETAGWTAVMGILFCIDCFGFLCFCAYVFTVDVKLVSGHERESMRERLRAGSNVSTMSNPV